MSPLTSPSMVSPFLRAPCGSGCSHLSLALRLTTTTKARLPNPYRRPVLPPWRPRNLPHGRSHRPSAARCVGESAYRRWHRTNHRPPRSKSARMMRVCELSHLPGTSRRASLRRPLRAADLSHRRRRKSLRHVAGRPNLRGQLRASHTRKRRSASTSARGDRQAASRHRTTRRPRLGLTRKSAARHRKTCRRWHACLVKRSPIRPRVSRLSPCPCSTSLSFPASQSKPLRDGPRPGRRSACR